LEVREVGEAHSDPDAVRLFDTETNELTIPLPANVIILFFDSIGTLEPDAEAEDGQGQEAVAITNNKLCGQYCRRIQERDKGLVQAKEMRGIVSS
jgi:hypothetical protein